MYNMLAFLIWFPYLTSIKISIKYCMEKKFSQILNEIIFGYSILDKVRLEL